MREMHAVFSILLHSVLIYALFSCVPIINLLFAHYNEHEITSNHFPITTKCAMYIETN